MPCPSAAERTCVCSVLLVGAPFQRGIDRDCDSNRVLVLPESEDRPVLNCEARNLLKITLPIAFDLLRPILMVPSRDRRVQRAAVPEAAVDEDGDTLPRENDIRSDRASASADWNIATVPASHPVQGTANS